MATHHSQQTRLARLCRGHRHLSRRVQLDELGGRDYEWLAHGLYYADSTRVFADGSVLGVYRYVFFYEYEYLSYVIIFYDK